MDKVDVYMTPDDFLRAITPGLGPAPNGKIPKLKSFNVFPTTPSYKKVPSPPLTLWLTIHCWSSTFRKPCCISIGSMSFSRDKLTTFDLTLFLLPLNILQCRLLSMKIAFVNIRHRTRSSVTLRLFRFHITMETAMNLSWRQLIFWRRWHRELNNPRVEI